MIPQEFELVHLYLKRISTVARQECLVRVVLAPDLIQAQLSADHNEPDVTVEVIPRGLSKGERYEAISPKIDHSSAYGIMLESKLG